MKYSTPSHKQEVLFNVKYKTVSYKKTLNEQQQQQVTLRCVEDNLFANNGFIRYSYKLLSYTFFLFIGIRCFIT